MTRDPSVVDWFAYAQQYDMLLEYNPYYQEARRLVLELVKAWDLPDNSTIADLGAGTGNYSVQLAKLLPQASVVHLENNRGMNALAAKKAAGLQNFQLLNEGITEAAFETSSLQGIICINALYTFPQPQEILADIYHWLAPGGKAILLDPGRVMNLASWKLAMAKHLLFQYGVRQTWKIFQQSKQVSKQNALIREQQRNGNYWTHSHQEFCQWVENLGLEVQFATTCFRGDCDLIMAQKPLESGES